MASRTIRGLTVEIGGDTKKLGEALKSVEKQTKGLKSELDDLNKLLRFDPSNVDALTQKKLLLGKAIESCAEKLKTLRLAERQMQEQAERGEDYEEKYRALQREIMETESKLGNFQRQLGGVNTALEKFGDESDEARRDVDGLGDEADKAKREVDDLGDKADKAEDDVSALGRAAEKAGDGFTVFKGTISNLISEALQELVELLKEASVYMLQTGMDFDETMSRVEALIDPMERTTENMDALTQKAMEMGAKTKFSANESAQAFTFLAQAGWNTEQMLSGIDGVMALAATDGVELATAAEITAQAINALGYEAKDAGKFADILAKTSAATCTDVEEMGYAFQYVGPVAGALGFKMEDLAIAIGSMADAGLTGEKAGTSLRSLFTNLAKPTDQMSAAMEKYGISLTDANGNMLPLMNVMKQLRNTFKGLTEEQQAELAATLAGKTGMAGLLSIVNSSDEDFKGLTNSIRTSSGAATEMAEIMQDNLAGDVEKLGGAFDTLAVKITDKFSGSMREGVQAITAFLDGEATMTETLRALGDALSGVIQSFKDYLPQLQQMGRELLSFLVTGLVNGLPELMATATQLVTDFCSYIASAAPGLVNIAGSLITSFVQGIFDFIPALITGAAEIVGSLARGISENAQNFVSKGLDLLDGFADKLTEAFPKLVENGMNFIKNLVTGLMQALPEFISRAPEIISKFANVINDNFPKILKKGVEIIWELIKGIIQAIPTLVKNIPKIITAIVDVWEAFNWLSLGKKALQWMGDGIKSLWGWIKSVGQGTLDSITNVIKNLPGKLLQFGKNAIDDLGGAIRNGWSTIKSGASTLLNSIVNFFKDLPGKMLNIGIDLVKGLWQGISDMTGWVIGKIQGFGENVLDGIKSFFGIKSPSREFAKIGMYLDQGLAEGLADYADDPIKAAQEMASSVLDGASMDGLSLERDMQQRAMKTALSVTTVADHSMLGKLDKILTAIERGQVIALDSKQLVGGTATAYDNALGQRRILAARGAL